jgi:hypothetical protein
MNQERIGDIPWEKNKRELPKLLLVKRPSQALMRRSFNACFQ